MTSLLGFRFKAVFGAALLLAVVPVAMAAQVTFDFEDPNQYGNADDLCVNNPAPPLFNRPGYGLQSVDYIQTPAGCDEGVYGGGFGNDSRLTAGINSTNSNLLRWSWVDPTDSRSWLRLPAYTASGQVVLNPSPTVELGVGSSIQMKVAIYALDASEFESPSGQLEFALLLRETGLNLPLGLDGGIAGDVEFVGIDSAGYGVEPDPVDASTPIGGTVVTHSASFTWTTLKWTFVDVSGEVKVEVSVDGGTPVQKDIIGLSGDGILSANHNRGTLDSLAIRKAEADTTSKKWFVWIDDIVIDAPGVTDPVYIERPVVEYDTEVTVKNIAWGDTPEEKATAIKLYINSVLAATINATDSGVDFSDGKETFTGLTLAEGDLLTATQVVDGAESDPSDAISVQTFGTIENFDVAPLYSQNPPLPPEVPDYGKWYETTSIGWGAIIGDTLDGSSAGALDDPGWTNGFYAIFPDVFPADGSYHVITKMHITEPAGAVNSIDQYQIGATPGGTHRVGSSMPACEAYGSYKGLTTEDDSALATQIVSTSEFEATVGQDLLIAFSTDVTSGGWNQYSRTWSPVANVRPYVMIRVDDIMLVEGPPPVTACDEVPPVKVGGPLLHDDTVVLVDGVGAGAVMVSVYVNDSLAGQLNTSTQGGGTKAVTLSNPVKLTKGDVVYATQTYPSDSGDIEGCVYATAVVGSGPNRNGVGVCIGVREVGGDTDIGEDGGFQGSIEFVGATGYLAGSAPDCINFVPNDGAWHQIVIDLSMDPSTLEWLGDPVLSHESGDGALFSANLTGTLEHIAIVPDRDVAYRDSGPWTVYIDDVVNNDVLITGFEEFATDTEQAMIRKPGFLSVWGQNMLSSPNTSVVVDSQAHDGSKSLKCEWQFRDEGDRWARLTTYSLYGIPSNIIPNPTIRFVPWEYENAYVSFWIRLDPPPPAPQYDLTASVVGGNGSVAPTSGSYDLGTVVPLVATPALGYQVKAWTGTDDDASTSNNNAVTMTTHKTVTVEFEVIPAQYTLSVTVVGLGTCDPMGGTYNEGTVVDLTAARTGDPASTIAWSGTDNDASTDLTNTVTMTSNKSVTVTFTEPSTCNDPAQDTDGDNDVDLTDFGVFSQCFNGPNRAYAVSSPPELLAKCECIDQDADGDVDLTDFGVFSSCFNGPNRAPGAGCP